MSDENKPTAPISKEEIQLGLLNKLVVSVGEMRDEQRQMKANVELVVNDLSVVKDRIAVVEGRATQLESRADSNSMRVKGQSELDLQQQAQLAQEKAAREELAAKVSELATKTDAQTAILERLDKMASNPTVKLILHAISVGLVFWLASKGIKLP